MVSDTGPKSDVATLPGPESDLQLGTVTRMLHFRAINGTKIESGSSGVVLEACVSDALPDGQAKPATVPGRALTEADAVEIWIARWLRIRRKALITAYGCDSRRLYEIWWGERFPGSQERARNLFCERYPALVDRTAFGYRRIPRKAPQLARSEQGDLFRRT